MVIAELGIHHAVATLARPEGVRQTPRIEEPANPSAHAHDHIVISSAARNHQRVRQVAAQVVASRYPELSPQQQRSRAAALEQKALLRFGGYFGDDPLSEDLLEAWLCSLSTE